VLATALELIDRDGIDGLSMRRLARELGRDPMILYRHAPNKAALLDGVAETVLAQLKVDPTDRDWIGQLRTVARDYRRLALAHPGVVPLLVTRPLATPLALRPRGSLRPLEDILALLTGAGFSGADALHIYRALFGFLHGHVLNELQELVENPDETDDLLRLGLHRLPIREFPPIAQPRASPGLLRRRHRTRTRPRHPPHWPDNSDSIGCANFRPRRPTIQ
jgi:AcrR family transcriptional regulator